MASELAFRMREDGYLMQINQLRDERDKLKAENAELMKLIGDAWEFACELYFALPCIAGLGARFLAIDARVAKVESQYKGEVS